MPSSRIDTTGISGSGTVSSTAHARSSVASAVGMAVEVVILKFRWVPVERSGACLPGGAGMLPREALHFGQHEAHVLRVLAMLAGRDVLDRFGELERGRVERGRYVFEPCCLEVRRQRPDAGGGDGFLHGVRTKKLTRVRQQIVERSLRAAMRLVRAVAETNQPFARMVHVIAGFLDRLRGDRCKLF